MKTMSSLVQTALIESLNEGAHAVAVFAADDQLLYANSTFLTLFGLTSEQLPLSFGDIMRLSFDRKRGLVINTDDFQAWYDGVQRRRRGTSKRSFEADFCDGRWVWVNETIDEHGTLCFIGTDITSLKLSESSMRRDRDLALHAANTDALTGLCNRRYMFECLEAALQALARSGPAFSLCMLDLDHFKGINDQHGHQAGDLVLQHFAAKAMVQLRPRDTLGRIGGEEFLLLLPDTVDGGAQQVLERLRQRLAEEYLVFDGSALRYTFSAGITVSEPGDTLSSLLQRVDQVLYGAKHAGRDCCLTSRCESLAPGQHP